MTSKDGATAEYNVYLKEDPESTAAVNLVQNQLRPDAHAAAPPGTEALVGGITAVFADIQKALNRDYEVVFPVAALIILVILGLLLRSLVAPWYLMVSVGLGFAATLGATVLVFQNLAGQAGLVFILPMYMYLFVVALGTDYNILMIARVREEIREGATPRVAAAHALAQAGPAIASAGLILAGTFGVADPGREPGADPGRLRGRGRHRAGGVRDGDVLLPQPDRAHRPAGLVAGALGGQRQRVRTSAAAASRRCRCPRCRRAPGRPPARGRASAGRGRRAPLPARPGRG